MSEISSTSELTTKEIVEQAIQDYHESILPYLNGQVPVIANKFDKANLYSTDEQIVGRWIDGKPLYQKTISGITPSNGDSNIAHNIHNIDKIVKREGFVITSSNQFIPFGFYNGLKYNDCFISREYLGMRMSSDPYGDLPYTLILQYTKTTDEAIAIGSDTDYSLEEKIVGTDIDGKTIYQKTINVSFTPITVTADKYAYYNDLNVGINNIANIIKCECRNTTNGMAMNYYAMPSLTANCIDLRCLNVLWPVDKLTLWYTKTTD